MYAFPAGLTRQLHDHSAMSERAPITLVSAQSHAFDYRPIPVCGGPSAGGCLGVTRSAALFERVTERLSYGSRLSIPA
jgi:hypothetical protein